MARSLLKSLIYIIVIFFLVGLFRINKEKNKIELIKVEEIEMKLTDLEIQNISALASVTLNSINKKSESQCPQFKNNEIFSENLIDAEIFEKDFKNNEFNKRYLEGAMNAIKQALRNANSNIKLVKTVYKGVLLKFPYAFE